MFDNYVSYIIIIYCKICKFGLENILGVECVECECCVIKSFMNLLYIWKMLRYWKELVGDVFLGYLILIWRWKWLREIEGKVIYFVFFLLSDYK